MSRSLTQIYSEAVTTRNNYMQLTNMKPDELSNSKLSILNLMTYVMSVLIYSYETILDVFQIDVATFISTRINGTGPWYAYMATLFQYDAETGMADKLEINTTTYKPEYVEVNKDHRIVAKSAYVLQNDEYDVTLKVCKSGDEDALYAPLSEKEMLLFVSYMESIKFIGTKIRYISKPGDILTLKATVYYNDEYTTAEDVLASIKSNLTNYAHKLDYNAYIYYQQIIDCVNDTENVVSVESGAVAQMESYGESEYGSPIEITNRIQAASGYIMFNNADGESTINTDNIKLLPASTME